MLYIAESSAPEDTLSISAIERGNLLHEALERFIKETPPRTSPAQTWNDAERGRLLEIGEELCDRAEATGLTGKAVLWQLARARIMRDLRGFLDADEALRAEHGVLPADVEMSFGMGDEQPIEVQIGGRTIAFRGRIDRVDRSPDGDRLVVLDYKSGSDYAYRDLDKDIVQRGTSLQLPVYALAAKQRFGDAEASAYYWFVNDRVNFTTKGGPMHDAALERFEEVIEAIGRGIEQGVFPANPGPKRETAYENCAFCAYDRACAADRARAWDRKHQAPEAREYVALAEDES
jgi:ATP-dependent helicase/DNAse subunit B